MNQRARGFRSCTAVLAAFVAFVVTEAIAQSARDAQLPGPIHLGRYEALDAKAHVRLWLGRYASPGLLANADVAYVYDSRTFCAAVTKPSTEEFYTERFAIARADARGYEVDALLQIKKVNYCRTAPAPENGALSVVTKTALDNNALPFVINWSAGASVGGTTVPIPAPKKTEEGNEGINAAPFVTSGTDLDARLLVAYEGALRSNGVWLQEWSQISRTWPVGAPNAVPGVVGNPELRMYRLVPSAAPPANAGERRYCLYSMQQQRLRAASEDACSADFSGIATKILDAARERKVAKPPPPPKASTAMPADLTELPRYVLVVQ